MSLPATVALTESIGRFLTDDSYFSKSAVKPKAFMPPLNLRLSVYRLDGLSQQNIWDIGESVVEAMAPKRVLHGVGEIKAGKVREIHLDIDPDDVPPRHACISGWPAEKAQQKSMAQELAAEAKLVLK